jgi:hypothetical protein
MLDFLLEGLPVLVIRSVDTDRPFNLVNNSISSGEGMLDEMDDAQVIAIVQLVYHCSRSLLVLLQLYRPDRSPARPYRPCRLISQSAAAAHPSRPCRLSHDVVSVTPSSRPRRRRRCRIGPNRRRSSPVSARPSNRPSRCLGSPVSPPPPLPYRPNRAAAHQ